MTVAKQISISEAAVQVVAGLSGAFWEKKLKDLDKHHATNTVNHEYLLAAPP